MKLFSFSKKNEASRRQIAPTLSNQISEGDTVVSSDSAKMFDLFANQTSGSGAVVTERTAMQVSAVYASVRLIAGAIAGLPKAIYQRAESGTEKIDHDYKWLLNERPCPSFSAATMWEAIVSQVLLRGDAICYLKRNLMGKVIAIMPWPRTRVEIKRIYPTDPRELPYNEYYFHGQGGYFGAQEEDVLHFPGFGFDGLCSMSVIQWGARNGIGIAIRGDEFAGKFFSQGAQPQFAIKAPSQMTPTQQAAFRDAWSAKYSGNGPNGIPLILTEGLDIKELSMTAADAQLLESRQWQVVDIARAFGVPPFMIAEMGKATYNNTENLGADFVKYTLSPHLIRFEQELNIKLFSTSRNFIKFTTAALLRADITARASYYKAALGGTQNPGWMTPNEVRELEDDGPLDAGDKLYTPSDQQKKSGDNNAQEPAAAGAG